jgi:methyltransferase-like protein
MNVLAVYRKREDIVTRRVAGETLLVPIRSHLADMQKIFALNSVAEYVWQQLDGRKSIEEIRQGVADTFAVEQEQAESDIREFLLQLENEGIIEEAD